MLAQTGVDGEKAALPVPSPSVKTVCARKPDSFPVAFNVKVTPKCLVSIA